MFEVSVLIWYTIHKTIKSGGFSMKKYLLSLLISVMLASIASAAVPLYIDYQGMLRDKSGNTQTGSFSMVFKIYDAATSGNIVYQETQTVSVSNGIYNVRLGAVDSSSVFDGSDRWLLVSVGGDDLLPRLRINSVAYAVRAETADYAAVAGTATLAATATTLASNANVSTTGTVTVGALTLNGGKLNITTGTNAIVGTGTIESGTSYVTVYNSAVTSNSIILLSVGPHASLGANINGGVRATTITGGSSFNVATMDNAVPSPAANISFSYLIIN